VVISLTKMIGLLAVGFGWWIPAAHGREPSELSENLQQVTTNDPVRRWSDSSGEHQIDASFLGYANGQACLRKADGSRITVPLDRLSELDNRYVRLKLRARVRAARKPETSPHLTEQERLRREVADSLVRKAIVADRNGQAALRNEMLARAVEADPDFGPARWLSGQICDSKNGEAKTWLSVERAEQVAAADPLLAEYSRRRDEATEGAKGQEALALWCRKHGLDQQEKIHWRLVLDHDPSHQGARRCLQLYEYQGKLMSREQIAAAKQHAVALEQKRKKWMPKLNAWRRAILSGGAAAEVATRKMARVRDPDLVGLLESYLSPRGDKLSRAVVEVIGKIPTQTATDSLVRHGLKSRWGAVRRAAIERLQQRPKYSYVPQLIDAMSSPLKLSSWKDGSDVRYTIEQEGKNVDQVLQGNIKVEAVEVFPSSGPNIDLERTLEAVEEAKRSRAEGLVRELRREVKRKNEAKADINEPIRQALAMTTGHDFGLDPSAWNDWWNDYHENEVKDKLVITRYKYDRAYAEFLPVQSCECFPAGTVVRTKCGQRPIEEIKVGDLVLSQHPDTGELTYKPVVGTTIRPAGKLLEIDIGDETLQTTKGHPMWVGGKGWRIAKFLERGDRLHRYFGSLEVEAVREVPAEVGVYNLVVDDFHTYFVGQNSVLVHDNSVLTPPSVKYLGEKSVAK